MVGQVKQVDLPPLVVDDRWLPVEVKVRRVRVHAAHLPVDLEVAGDVVRFTDAGDVYAVRSLPARFTPGARSSA